MSRAENRGRLLRFLETIRKPEKPLDKLTDEENLVRAGLIDSLAVLEIIAFLEREFGIDFLAAGIDPGRLSSINQILDLTDEGQG